MAMALNASKLLQRFLRAQGTQDSIQSLSLYCQANDAKSVIPVWMDALRRCDVATIVPLWYVANDVLQRSRSKTSAFVTEFAKVLEAAGEVSGGRLGDAAMQPLVRVVGIWADRLVYSQHFASVIREGLERGAAKFPPPGSGRGSEGGTHMLPPPSHAAPEAKTDDAAAEDAVMAQILSGSLQEAFNEAQRRHRITVASTQLLSALNPAYANGTFNLDGGDSGGGSEPSDDVLKGVLAELHTAERHARYSLAVARMNMRRRPAFIAKLSEALATESEKLQNATSSLDNFGQSEALLQRLQQGKESEGKTIRLRVSEGGNEDAYSSFGGAFGGCSTPFGGLGLGESEMEDPLMADDWGGYSGPEMGATRHHMSTAAADGAALMSAYDSEEDDGGVTVPTTTSSAVGGAGAYTAAVAGRKRSRPHEMQAGTPAAAAEVLQYTGGEGARPSPFPSTATSSFIAGVGGGGDGSDTGLAQATPSKVLKTGKSTALKPQPISVDDLLAQEGLSSAESEDEGGGVGGGGGGNDDFAGGGGGAAHTPSASASGTGGSAGFDLARALGGQRWDPIMQAYVAEDDGGVGDDSWRDH